MLEGTDDLLFLLFSQCRYYYCLKSLFVITTSKIYWGSKTYFAYMLLARQKGGLMTHKHKEKQRNNLKALTI